MHVAGLGARREGVDAEAEARCRGHRSHAADDGEDPARAVASALLPDFGLLRCQVRGDGAAGFRLVGGWFRGGLGGKGLGGVGHHALALGLGSLVIRGLRRYVLDPGQGGEGVAQGNAGGVVHGLDCGLSGASRGGVGRGSGFDGTGLRVVLLRELMLVVGHCDSSHRPMALFYTTR